MRPAPATVGPASLTLFSTRHVSHRSAGDPSTATRHTTSVTLRGGLQIWPVRRVTTSYRQVPANEYGVYGGYWTDDLKQAYQYPAYGSPAKGGATGAGVTIGIVMENQPGAKDAAKYWADEDLRSPPTSSPSRRWRVVGRTSRQHCVLGLGGQVGRFDQVLSTSHVGGQGPDLRIRQHPGGRSAAVVEQPLRFDSPSPLRLVSWDACPRDGR